MSEGRNPSRSPIRASGSKGKARQMTVYDRLEDARERRKAVLAAKEAGNAAPKAASLTPAPKVAEAPEIPQRRVETAKPKTAPVVMPKAIDTAPTSKSDLDQSRKAAEASLVAPAPNVSAPRAAPKPLPTPPVRQKGRWLLWLAAPLVGAFAAAAFGLLDAPDPVAETPAAPEKDAAPVTTSAITPRPSEPAAPKEELIIAKVAEEFAQPTAPWAGPDTAVINAPKLLRAPIAPEIIATEKFATAAPDLLHNAAFSFALPSYDGNAPEVQIAPAVVPPVVLTATPPARPVTDAAVSPEITEEAPNLDVVLVETQVDIPLDNIEAVVAPSTPPLVLDAGLEIVLHYPNRVALASAEALTGTAANAGFTVDKLRPSGFSISKTNIRYFHEEDAAAAEVLADAIGGDVRDFTSFRPSPSKGIVEIWMAGRGQGAAQADERPGLRESIQRELNRLQQELRAALGG